MKRIMIAAVAALALAGCGKGGMEAGGTTVPARSITGPFTLTDSSSIARPAALNGGCYGLDGYDDIEAGLRVVVSDGGGKTLQTGSLGPGTFVKDPQYPTIGDCVFPIEMSGDLPKADFYKVAVGRRGELTYSYDELEQNDWEVSFTLG